MVTIEEVYEQAYALTQGDKPISVKLALQYSACSIMQALDLNCRMAEVLRAYRDVPLPNRDELKRLLRGKGLTFERTFDTLYYVEYLESEGLLDGLEYIGDGYAEQCAWRNHVRSLVKGHGLSFKCISLAALLISPLTCELVPVDRHVMARLDVPRYVSNCISANLEVYMDVEHAVHAERDEEHPGMTAGIHHWYRWELWRQELGISHSDTCETHDGLNVRK